MLFLSFTSLIGLYVVWAECTANSLRKYGIHSRPSYATFVLGPVIDAIKLMSRSKEVGDPIPSFIWVHWAFVIVLIVTVPYVLEIKRAMMN